MKQRKNIVGISNLRKHFATLVMSYIKGHPDISRKKLLDISGLAARDNNTGFEEVKSAGSHDKLIVTLNTVESSGFTAVLMPYRPNASFFEQRILKAIYDKTAPGGWLFLPSMQPQPDFTLPPVAHKWGRLTIQECAAELVKAGFKYYKIQELYPASTSLSPFGYILAARKIVRSGKKASVVIPAYNQAEFLNACVDSMLMQTYKNKEIIVINDGSTDNTHNVLRAYGKKIRYIKQKNMDVPLTINKGFDLSQGDYWMWSSSDNIAMPHMLDTLATALDNHPEVGLVYADYCEMTDYGEFLREVRLPSFSDERLLKRALIGYCYMFRRECFEAIGKSPLVNPHAHDVEIHHRVSELYPILHVPVVLYAWRRHDIRKGDHWEVGLKGAIKEMGPIIAQAKMRRGTI